MHEHELVGALLETANEIAADELGLVEITVLEEVAQRIEGEALADDRRRLQRGLVARGKAVEAREDDALDRAGNGHAIGTAAQQLSEEERIALRTLDAAPRDSQPPRRGVP